MTQDRDVKIDRIGQIFSATQTGAPPCHRVSQSELMSLMKDDDLEVQGCVYAHLEAPNALNCVDPPLTSNDWEQFAQSYLGRCILQNPDGEWAHGSFPAAWDSVSLVRNIFNRANSVEADRQNIKRWIENLLRASSGISREAIVTGLLEHVFEEKQILRYFEIWRDDPDFSGAYQDAILWSLKGGLDCSKH